MFSQPYLSHTNSLFWIWYYCNIDKQHIKTPKKFIGYETRNSGLFFHLISFVFRLFFSGNQPLMSLREWCINCYKLSKEMPVFWCCKFFTLLSFFFRTLLGFRWAYVIYSENWALNRVTTQTWKLNSMTFPWHSSCFQSLRKH